nr:hypothetical protein BaRGS_034785 [Batillaria attramentaria]
MILGAGVHILSTGFKAVDSDTCGSGTWGFDSSHCLRTSESPGGIRCRRPGCDWEHYALPIFLYSNATSKITWSHGPIGTADVLAIFVKFLPL